MTLSRLRDHTPTQLWAELQQGEFSQLDNQSGDRTQSILACIEYAYHDIDPQDQALLMCLAPFNGVIGIDVPFGETTMLNEYIKYLKQQPLLAHLPFERFHTLLKIAQQRGLMISHEIRGYFRLQPIFPYFLRNKIQTQNLSTLQESINISFRIYYEKLSGLLMAFFCSKVAQEKQFGFTLAQLEYENLSHALDLALTERVSVYTLQNSLSFYFDATQDQPRGLQVDQMVLTGLSKYPAEVMHYHLGEELVWTLNNIARRFMITRKYTEAEQTYQQLLDFVKKSNYLTEESRQSDLVSVYNNLGVLAEKQRQWSQSEVYYKESLRIDRELKNDYNSQAHIYHNLGIVAGEQQHWSQAEAYYQQALQIFISIIDRYAQAQTYFQLGILAQKQKQWYPQAKTYYEQALQIFIEFNDHYVQAGTYHSLGMVAEEQEQWSQAEGYYQQALQIYVELNKTYEQAATYHQLGNMACRQEQWVQGEAYYKQTLHIYIQFNNSYKQAATYHNLGIVAQKQQKLLQAEAYHYQALQIYIEFNDRQNQAISYAELGLLAKTQTHWVQAVDYLLQSLVIFIEYQDEDSIDRILWNLIQILKTANETGLWNQVAQKMEMPVEDVKELFRELKKI